MEKKIHFIITGGTIDSFYYPPTESGKPLSNSIIPEYILETIQPYAKVSFEVVCMKDSRSIKEADRKKILKAALKANTDNIIITHGTVTMERTAEFLKDRMPLKNKKTIVLTGAMTPLKQFVMSDGGFNLGFALASCLHEKPGVYICMNGRVFPAGTATKNKKTARFELKK